jgi:hypothetical protein
LLPSKTVVLARAPGLAPSVQQIDLRPGQVASVSICLSFPAAIVARIVDDAGRLAPSARLRVSYPEEVQTPAMRALAQTSTTTHDGLQTISGILTGGPVTVEIVDGKKRGDRVNVKLTPAETRRLTMVMR